jgi:hypothetical protein
MASGDSREKMAESRAIRRRAGPGVIVCRPADAAAPIQVVAERADK